MRSDRYTVQKGKLHDPIITKLAESATVIRSSRPREPRVRSFPDIRPRTSLPRSVRVLVEDEAEALDAPILHDELNPALRVSRLIRLKRARVPPISVREERSERDVEDVSGKVR